MVDSLIGPSTGGGAQIQPQADTTSKELSDIAPLEAVAKGEPPAVYADLSKPTPAIKVIADNLPQLGQLGLQLYRGQNAIVLFNPQVLPPETIKKADQSGQLQSVAAPLDALLGGEAPEQGAEGETAPQTEPEANSSQITTGGMTKPTPPRVQSKIAGLRIKGLMDDEAPSDRPAPGQGKILNGLIQRAY